MNKGNFFTGLLISAIAASSIYATDVNLVLTSSNDKAPMWLQKSGVSDFKMITFPARVNLSEFSSIASFQVVNATPLDGSGNYPKEAYKATIESGVVKSIIKISDKSDVTTAVKDLMFADGTKLKGNNPYYVGNTAEEINVKLVFKTGTLATFDVTADTDGDGIVNGEDYCPYTPAGDIADVEIKEIAVAANTKISRGQVCKDTALGPVCEEVADTGTTTNTDTTVNTDTTGSVKKVSLKGCPSISVEVGTVTETGSTNTTEQVCKDTALGPVCE